MVRSNSGKFIAYEYVLPGLKVSETKTVSLKLVQAKSSYFDMLALILCSAVAFGLQSAFKFIGFEGASAKRE